MQKKVGWKYEGRVSPAAMLVVFAIVGRSGFANPSESCLPPILSLPRLNVLSDLGKLAFSQRLAGFHTTSRTHVGVARKGVLDDVLIHVRRIWGL